MIRSCSRALPQSQPAIAPVAEDAPPREAERPADDERSGGGGTATATKTRPAPPRTKHLPRFRVILHDDDVNTDVYVTLTILELTRLNRVEAHRRMLEADRTGCSQLLLTHREHAELLEEQFRSRHLTVTIEPED